jgi:hypothetical protein
VKDVTNTQVTSKYPQKTISSFLKSSAFKNELTSTMNMSSGFRGNITYDFSVHVTKMHVSHQNDGFLLKVYCDVKKRPNKKALCLDVKELKDHVAFALREMSYRGKIPASKPILGKYSVVLQMM